MIAAVMIIIAASVFYGFRKAAREDAKPPPNPLAEARAYRKLDPESRRLLVTHLAEARGQREASELPHGYVDMNLKAIRPLLQRCNERALTGKLVLRLAIVGEPTIGGLVEAVEIDEQTSTAKDPVLNACVRAQLAGIELVAPMTGGRVEVTFPLELAP